MNFKRIKSNQWGCFEGILKCKYILEWAVNLFWLTLDPPLSSLHVCMVIICQSIILWIVKLRGVSTKLYSEI